MLTRRVKAAAALSCHSTKCNSLTLREKMVHVKALQLENGLAHIMAQNYCSISTQQSIVGYGRGF